MGVKGNLVIQSHQRWRLVFELLVVAALGIAITYIVRVDRSEVLEIERKKLVNERNQLAELNLQLTETNSALRERVAILERARQIENKAYDEVNDHLRALQDEILALKEEVAFYQGIVTSSQSRGLKIQDFRLKSGEDATDYRFALVLTQNIRNDKEITGKVALSVAGKQAGTSKTLHLRDMYEGEVTTLGFKFKYYQRLEGSLKLPVDFEPTRVFVNVIPQGERATRVEKVFEWARSTS